MSSITQAATASLPAVPTITIDPELQRLIPPLRQEEFLQLEANILRDGCKDALSVWQTEGQNVLVDGHNRYAICQKHGLTYKTVPVESKDRDHAKLWMRERQLGTRNLPEKKFVMLVDDIREDRSRIALSERNSQNRRSKTNVSDKTTGTLKGKKKDNRKAVAKEFKVRERALRTVQEIKKAAPEILEKVFTDELDVSLPDAKKIAKLPEPQRKKAVSAIEGGADVRTALRDVKKEQYNATVEAAKPKPLEGTYRIIYADPPWKYVGLNQADEYGHAERHYDCLTDQQLCDYRIGNRPVKDTTDDNAVMFLWVTSPLLERCFAIIKAWGFQYKSSFVWDKVKHNMGHYNSVRHELLLICTKGSCKPDVSKLVDSVQVIERSSKHSEKPEEFRSIIESLYDHGRKLELFARTRHEGWDADGNEVAT